MDLLGDLGNEAKIGQILQAVITEAAGELAKVVMPTLTETIKDSLEDLTITITIARKVNT